MRPESNDHLDQHFQLETNASLLRNKEATKVLFISLIAMLATAIIQVVLWTYSGSVALLADTIHNFGDALTSIPLWIAFFLSRRPPTKRFTYGMGRSEDLAGLFIIAVILGSAGVAGYQSVMRFFNPIEGGNLWVTAAAALIGFAGNETVAIYRIRMGRKIGSAALIADGQHARMDGVTSLAVLIGVVGIWAGFPLLDPIVGIVITVLILFIAKDSAKLIFTQMLDGIEPETVERINHTALQVSGVNTVSDVKARWCGHEIKTELNITVDSELSVAEGHEIAKEVIHALIHEIEHLGEAHVHVDPFEEEGSIFHSHSMLNRGIPLKGSDIRALGEGDNK
ncbi:MAG: cation transporter [Gorillibacterium sp.]|nr:cation transporter [Gorillibacterium sp.]